MERAIILAAGKGQRLVNGLPFPKPLTRVGGVPLLVRALRNLERYGVREATVVVGHQAHVLERGVGRYQVDLDVSFVRNEAFEGPDGLSLLAARERVVGPTLLLMGDTLNAPELLAPLIARAPRAGRTVLAADFDGMRGPEADAAVKLRVSGNAVAAVGKDLSSYDALSTGSLVLTPALLEAVERAETHSLEAGLRRLAAAGQLEAVSVDGARWIDVDTRDAHALAERSLARYGEALQPTPLVAGL